MELTTYIFIAVTALLFVGVCVYIKRTKTTAPEDKGSGQSGGGGSHYGDKDNRNSNKV